MQHKTVIIDHHFNGPDVSANGGYACGLMASVLASDSAYTMRLHSPPPLDTEMVLSYTPKEAKLTLRGQLIGEAKATELALSRPRPPGDTVIFRASKDPIQNSFDFLRRCYVCGPDRDKDGLHIHPGKVPGKDGEVACFWQTSEKQKSEHGSVGKRHIWSALDCPGYFACAAGKPALLGSITGQVFKTVEVGENLRIHAWTIDSSGRKHRAGVAIYDINFDLVALADQLWIEVKDEMFESLRG